MAEHGPANDFYYSPLSAPGLLRLLKVLPERLDDRLQICLWESPPTVPYRCLSYMWGDQAERFPILVNGHVYTIGKSLYTFLETARYKFPNEILWIDAICINQSDNAEKSLQVQRMGKTFSNAIEVLIWLGCNQLFAELLECIPSNCDGNENIDEFRLENPSESFCKALEELLSHPYWNRAWITQEIMLSQRSRLLCGVTDISAKDVFILLRAYYMSKDIFIFKHNLRNILTMLARIGKGHQPIIFQRLLRERRQTQCENPRDRLFSLLAIIGHDTTFIVNYDESLVCLYLRSVSYFSAWKNHSIMANLAYLLGLDRSIISSQTQSAREDIYLDIPMRHSMRLNDLYHTAVWSPRPVQRCLATEAAADPIFLHLRSAEDEEAYNRPFFKIQRSGSSGAEESFSLEINSPGNGSVQCPANTEIWTSDCGSMMRLRTWTDMTRIIELNAHMEGTEKAGQLHCEADFLVKLPLHSHVCNFLEDREGWDNIYGLGGP